MKANEIYADILRQITEGVWNDGDRLPTERTLAEQYGVSRPTISRVFNRLRDSGQLKRVVGAGTFLTQPVKSRSDEQKNIGLFVPGLGNGEIFEPICTRIAELSHPFNVALIWGSLPGAEVSHQEKMIRAAERLIEQGVHGVFFQPVEREDGVSQLNLRIAETFEKANIPLVLLDSDYVEYPLRSNHDLVGVDNIAVGYELCKHFIDQGATRVDFMWQPNAAQTLSLRKIGYREALLRAGIAPNSHYEHEGHIDDHEFIERLIASGATNIICSNDETAVELIHALELHGKTVPADIRIAGVDDIKFAQLARVPLTTMAQPCRELGELALNAMIERIANPSLPARIISTNAILRIRESSSIS